MADKKSTAKINPKVTASKSPTPSKTNNLNEKGKVMPKAGKGGKMC